MLRPTPQIEVRLGGSLLYISGVYSLPSLPLYVNVMIQQYRAPYSFLFVVCI